MIARLVITALLALTLSGCATTAPPQITPVMDDSALVTEAIAVRPAAPSADIFDPKAEIARAEAAMTAEDFAAALSAYQTLLLASPKDARALRGYGDAALAMGRADLAAAAFRALPADAPGRLSGLTVAEIALGERDDVHAALSTALAETGDDTRLLNAMGQYWDSQGRTLLAQDYYLRALALATKNGVISAASLNNLGMSYRLAGRFDEAKAKFAQARAINPDRALYDNNYRLTLAMDGDYDGAVAGLSGMRAADLMNDAGVIAEQRGERDIAQTLFEYALYYAPRHHVKAAANLAALRAP